MYIHVLYYTPSTKQRQTTFREFTAHTQKDCTVLYTTVQAYESIDRDARKNR